MIYSLMEINQDQPLELITGTKNRNDPNHSLDFHYAWDSSKLCHLGPRS